MKTRSNTGALSVATASRIRMRLNVTRTACMLGDIAGPAQHFSCWAAIELFMRVPIGPVKPIHAVIAVKSSDAVVELRERGTQPIAIGRFG